MARWAWAVPWCAALAGAARAGVMADRFRASIPRFGAHEGDDFDPRETRYLMGVGYLAAVPVFFALVTVWVGLAVCFCRVCSRCCSCCRRCPCGSDGCGGGGLHPRERLIPLALLAGLCAVCAGFAGAAIADNERLEKTLLEDGAESLSFKSLVPRAVEMVQAKLDSVMVPLDEMLGVLDETVFSGNETINSLIVNIDTGADGFINATVAFEDKWSGDQSYTSGEPQSEHFSCLACPLASALVGNMGQELDGGIALVVEDLRDLRTTFQLDLAEIVPDIREKVEDFRLELNTSVQDALDDARNTSDEAIAYVEEHQPTLHASVLTLFLLPLLVLATLPLAVFFRKAWPLHAEAGVYVFLCFQLWLLLGVFLPLAVGLGDACDYADHYEKVRIPERAAEATEPDDTYRMAQACLTGENLIVVLNKSREFEFADELQFPEFGNLTEQFDLVSLRNLSDLVADVTYENMFGYSYSDRVEGPIAAFVDAAGPGGEFPTALADFLAADPAEPLYGLSGPEQTQMAELQAVMAIENATIAELQRRRDDLAADAAGLDAARDDSLALLHQAVEPINNMSNLTQPLLDAAQRVRDQATCGVVVEIYRKVNWLVCSRLGDHLAVMCMCLFFVAFFGWGVLLAAWLALRTPKGYTQLGQAAGTEGK